MFTPMMKSIICLFFPILGLTQTDTLAMKPCCIQNCVSLLYAEGENFAPDTLYTLKADGGRCHGILLPEGSVSSISNYVTGLNNFSGYTHDNESKTTEFGYYLGTTDNGCIALFTYDGRQSGVEICP